MRRLLIAPVVAGLLSLAGAAHASIVLYTANLTGANESPVNASPGIGFATVTIDDVLNTLQVDVSFSGLVGTTTAAHIHCCTATPGAGTVGVAITTPTFAGFPLGVTSGSYSNLFDLTLPFVYNTSFVTANGGSVVAAEATLLSGIAAGRTYFNIHTTAFPGGEIRGFLVAAVPEPATWTMLIAGFGGLGCVLRRRRAAVMA